MPRTCMNDIVVMGIIQCHQELNGKSPHDWIGNHVFEKPDTEASKSLPHELKDEANMDAIGSLVLEVIQQVADIGVARVATVSLS